MKYLKLILTLTLIVVSTLRVQSQAISPTLVGTNVWYNDPGELAWQVVEEADFKIIRIGGHAYDRNLPSKETLLDWVQKIRKAGAEPLIQVSQYGTAEDAAEIVRFFNVEMKGKIPAVKYWGIGNEPWLQADRPDHDVVGAMVEKYFKPAAVAMKEIDPSIKIYGPNFCDYLEIPINDLFGGKNDIAGKIPGKDYYYVDGLSFHRYPQGSGDPAVEGANDLLERFEKAKAKIDEVNTAKNRTADNALIWGIGEFNSKGGPEVHTWGNGQMFGAAYGYAMEYGAKFLTSWSMFEHNGDRIGSDFSLIDGKNMVPRASYRHMEFVAQHFKGRFLKGESSDDNFVVYGAKDGKKVSVMILNRGFGKPLKYALNLNLENMGKSGLNLAVDAGIEEEYSDTIQVRSTHVLIFEGNSITKITYSSEDFENEIAPKKEVIR